MSQENLEVVRAALEARSGFLSVFDENAEMQAPDWGLDPGLFRETEAIRTWLRTWVDRWDEYEAENHEYIDAGEYVVVEQALRGRSKATGLSLDARHWSVFTFTNRKVVRGRFYRTRDEALEAAGLRA
jgi:ketosteroid isomerase-like protein